MNTPETRQLTVFTKRPRPGRVKTRLCPPLAPDDAARLAQAMLDDTLERHLACDAYTTGAAIAPPPEGEDGDDLAWLRARYPALQHTAQQVGAGLGERMAHEFATRATDGRTLVIVGSDCPSLVPDDVRRAHDALTGGADVVFSPDAGGGYSLVGLARPLPELFVGVPMSTGDMFERTLDVARGLRLAVVLLAPRDDVDHAGDLLRLLETLQRSSRESDFPRRTYDRLVELESVLR